jgi:CubicO group peptidase (beta-lactamase class C family)
VDDIRKGGDRAPSPAGYTTLPGWSYRNMWWVTHNEHGAYMARGIHGQAIYIDPKAEMVIAHFGLTQDPFSIAPDPRYLFMSERHREALAHLLYGVARAAAASCC